MRGLATPAARSAKWGQAGGGVRALLLVALGWALVVAGPGPAGASPFADVHPSHWAYAAVEQLSESGLVPGYGPRSFAGGRRMTRYEMALLVARLVDRLEGAALDSAAAASHLQANRRIDLLDVFVRYNAVQPEDGILQERDMYLITRLSGEFRYELSVLGYRFEVRDTSLGQASYTLSPSLDGREISGESRVRVQEVFLPPASLSDPPRTGGAVLQTNVFRTYFLRMRGQLAGNVRLETNVTGSQSLWDDKDFTLRQGDLQLGIGDSVVARIGDLSEARRDSLALRRPDGLEGVQAGIQLGQIGSTVLIARTGQPPPGGENLLAALDGTIHLSDRVVLGATLLRTALDGEGEPQPIPGKTVASLEGTFLVSPTVMVSGEYAQSASPVGEGGAVALGASIRMGDVEVGSRFRSVGEGFEPAFGSGGVAEDAAGYDLTVRLGDVRVTTGRGTVYRSSETQLQLEKITSLRLQYDVSEGTAVRGSYQFVDLDDLRERRAGSASRATLDLDIAIPQGTLRFGWAYEGSRDGERPGAQVTTVATAGVEYQLNPDAQARAEFSIEDRETGSRKTTQLGLRYTLSPEAAVLLGYRLVDFSRLGTGTGNEDERPGNVTTAEFTIRF